MEPTSTYRPRISRETRLLLTAALAAVAVLWLLARVRFRDSPSPPSPIPAVLSQLTGGPKLDELASEVSAVTTRVQPSVVVVDAGPSSAGSERRLAALRVRDDLALAWLPSPASVPGLLARDRATGIALLRTPGPRPTPPPPAWTPRAPQVARFVVATEIVGAGVSLRPAFMPSFVPTQTPLWSEPLWAVPAGTDLAPGSIVFTGDAEVIGLVITSAGRRLIVPAAPLAAFADRLLAAPPGPAGVLGIEAQDLTPAIASAAGATSGVVVSWVAPAGPAQAQVRIGDVIETIDGRQVNTRGDWDVVTARLSAGTAVTLRVRRGAAVHDVALVPTAAAPAPTDALGLTMRPRARGGAEIVRVDPGSSADRAGLTGSDVITLVGDVAAPTPRQVTRTFGSLQPGQRVLLGVARGEAHFVTTLERLR